MLKTTLASVFSSPFSGRGVQIKQVRDSDVTDCHKEKVWGCILKRVLERFAHGLDVRCERKSQA